MPNSLHREVACRELDGRALQGHVTLGTYMPLSPMLEFLTKVTAFIRILFETF